jgi:hypothetical protein
MMGQGEGQKTRSPGRFADPKQVFDRLPVSLWAYIGQRSQPRPTHGYVQNKNWLDKSELYLTQAGTDSKFD